MVSSADDGCERLYFKSPLSFFSMTEEDSNMSSRAMNPTNQ